jgi:hypothetical protein
LFKQTNLVTGFSDSWQANIQQHQPASHSPTKKAR